MSIVTLLAIVLVLVGLAGIIATWLGWYDEGGLMQRLNWLDTSALLNHPKIGGGARRANYLICGPLLFLGLVALIGAA